MSKKKDPLEGAEEMGTTLEDFVIEQKITAFTNAYECCEVEKFATKVFDETKLRAFFKAYPCSLGDPLTIYLNRLEAAGFVMRVSMMEEPAIFVMEKAVGGMALLEEGLREDCNGIAAHKDQTDGETVGREP